MRVIDRDRGWVLVLPDPADAVTHLWAEGNDADSAQLLLDEWAATVVEAGELLCCLRGDDPPAPPDHGRASPLRSLPTGGRRTNRAAPCAVAGVKALWLR